MKNIFTILIIISVTLITLPVAISGMDRSPKPDAIVIDDETGKPVEGAVAIAIWRGPQKDCTLIQGLEGGCWGALKIEETVSDKEGKIFIKNFWDWHLGPDRYPRLTVYKFGYVCWDQKKIFEPKWKWKNRTDFDKDNRIVRLKKWMEGFSFNEHGSFIGSSVNWDDSKAQDKLFWKAIRKEVPSKIYETQKKEN
jgi:hypothetical protein